MRCYAIKLLLLGVVVSGCPAILQAAETKTSGLVAKIEPLNYKYCVGEGGGALHILAEIEFVNSGSQRLILYAASGAILEMRAAKTKADLEAGRLEGRMSYTIVTEHLGPPPLQSWLEPSISDFVILSPGDSFGTQQTLALVYRNPGEHFRALDPGEHYVQFVVETWPESSDLGKLLFNRWKKWGDLWFRPTVVTEPLRVDIQANPKTGNCE